MLHPNHYHFYHYYYHYYYSHVLKSKLPPQILDYGLILHPGSYMREMWNCMDLIVVSCALTSFIMDMTWAAASLLHSLKSFSGGALGPKTLLWWSPWGFFVFFDHSRRSRGCPSWRPSLTVSSTASRMSSTSSSSTSSSCSSSPWSASSSSTGSSSSATTSLRAPQRNASKRNWQKSDRSSTSVLIEYFPWTTFLY